MTADPVPEEAEAAKWASALVVAGGGSIPTGEKRGVVVCEVRADDGTLAKAVSYPQKADLYFRTDPDCDFGARTPDALTLGVNVEQGMLWGFSSTPGIVHVGPAHPAYAAANLAAQRGATEIEVQGLSPRWRKALQPWFDKLATDPWHPSDVSVKLT